MTAATPKALLKPDVDPEIAAGAQRPLPEELPKAG
jgi:hypothetical protein